MQDNGRIVFTNNRGLTGVGVSRKAFENPGAWQSEDITLSVDAEIEDAPAAIDFVRHRAVRAMKDAPVGCVFSRTITDDTQPGAGHCKLNREQRHHPCRIDQQEIQNHIDHID